MHLAYRISWNIAKIDINFCKNLAQLIPRHSPCVFCLVYNTNFQLVICFQERLIGNTNISIWRGHTSNFIFDWNTLSSVKLRQSVQNFPSYFWSKQMFWTGCIGRAGLSSLFVNNKRQAKISAKISVESRNLLLVKPLKKCPLQLVCRAKPL